MALIIVGDSKFKIIRAGTQAEDLGKSLCGSMSLKAEFLLPRGTSVLSLKTLN